MGIEVQLLTYTLCFLFHFLPIKPVDLPTSCKYLIPPTTSSSR